MKTTEMIGIIGYNKRFIWRVLQCLAAAGRKAYVLTDSKGVAESVFRQSRYCLGVAEMELDVFCSAPVASAPGIQAACDKLGINVLVPVHLPSTLLLAHLQSILRNVQVYPVSRPDLIQSLANKLSFAKLLSAHSLPQPAWFELESEAQLTSLPFPYPVIIKPAGLEGGEGVKICANAEAALKHARRLKLSPEHPLEVQELIPGSDLDISVLANHGKLVAWAVQRRSSRKLGPSLASCSFEEHPGLLESTRKLAEAIQFHGIMHIDARIDERDNSVKFIECNPRMYESIQFAAYAGLNFVEAGLQLLNGAPSATHWKQPVGVVNMPPACWTLLTRNTGENIPIWTPGTRMAWGQMLRDPVPWLRLLRQRCHQQDSVSSP